MTIESYNCSECGRQNEWEELIIDTHDDDRKYGYVDYYCSCGYWLGDNS
jgi:DNA-directed RNA polymerase subunit RPC12/RpoP